MTTSSKKKGRLSRTVRENLGDAELALKDFPKLQELGIAILENGDPAAMERLRQIGLAISDILYYGAVTHKEVRNVIEHTDAIPVSLSAFQDLASTYVEHLYDKLGFGRSLGFRTASGKGGPKRFRSESAPSFVALELYYAIIDFVIPEDACEARERMHCKMQARIAFVKKHEPVLIGRISAIRFTTELALLPKLTGDTYMTWADVGTRLLVDFPDSLKGYCVGNVPPPIPETWIAKAAKRKGKKGALKDILRKELEAGFRSLALSVQ